MPDVTFDLRSTSAYIQGFAALRNALSPRQTGRVLEMEVIFASGRLILYMEAAGLYLIGFQNAQGQVMALDGDNQPFNKYLDAKFGNEKVKDSGIKAKYIGDSWGVKVIKSTQDQTLAIKSFGPDDTRITTTKQHLDRMAFVIAEAARFMPIRCAVACVLHDDYRFLAVLGTLKQAHAESGPRRTQSCSRV